MAALIESITPFLQAYGTIGIFFISFIEEVIAPIPSIFSLMAAGFFLIPSGAGFYSVAWHGLINVAVPAGLGLTAGAFLVYAALYFGGAPLIQRWGKYVGLSWKHVERAEARFIEGKVDEWLIFTLRVIPFVPNVGISAVCGLFRYPLKSFLLLTFLGGMVRAFFLGLIGWSVGAAYTEYAGELSRIGTIAAVLFAVAAVAIVGIVIVRKKLRSR